MSDLPHQADRLRLDLVLPPHAAVPKQPGRPTRLAVIWHDTPDGALAAQGRALIETGSARHPQWRLQATRPTSAATFCLPGGPDVTVAEAADRLQLDVPASVVPVIQLQARTRWLKLPQPDVTAQLLEGILRAGDIEQPVRRLLLSGPMAQVEAAALAVGAQLPAVTASGQALAMVWPGPPRRAGPPVLAPDMSVGAGFAHIVAHLTDIIVALVPAALEGAETEPVHQMRVAIRRLRSAISLFGRAVDCEALVRVKEDTKRLARALGPARAWDVFLAETGHAIASAVPDDPAVPQLLAAADTCRQAAYAALRDVLTGADFGSLTIRLACLAGGQPWDHATAATPLADFADHALKRRHKRLRVAGRHIASLDIEALHDLRLKAKHLRYAAEFFAPLYPAHASQRILRRLADLQDVLGNLNDTATADGLLAELPAAVGQGYPGGLVRGFIAGSHTTARSAIEVAWHRLRKHAPPWR